VKTIGLTGSIGMGKSTTAAMFAAQGAAVYDADAAVHELYGPGGAAVSALEAAFPGVAQKGAIDRGRLAERVLNDPIALKRLEDIVHPLVGRHRQDFFARTAAAGEPLVVLDVPLLFETGGDKVMDGVVVVSAPATLQRDRVLARPGMTIEKLDAILRRQIPDVEKRARADFVIDTSQGLESAQDAVRQILQTVSDPQWRSVRPR
jgi:dephospho-CoA kinase